jgi:hypothetical protein
LKPTRLGYCQFLLSTHTNFTLTHYAEHTQYFSHDSVIRYIKLEKLTASMIWEHVKGDIVFCLGAASSSMTRCWTRITPGTSSWCSANPPNLSLGSPFVRI